MKNLFIFAKNSFREKEIKFIPNSMSARGEALIDKYNLFSIYSFEKEPPQGEDSKEQNEPMRYEDLWINILYKDNPEKAIMDARNFIEKMMYKFDKFNPAMLHYYVNGNIGCQICMPAIMFGGEDGHQLLPLIHKEFLRNIFYFTNKVYLDPCKNKWGIVDASHYILRTGGFILEENMRISEGRYRIPVSWESFFNKNISDLLEMITHSNEETIKIIDAEKTDLCGIYRSASIMVNHWKYPNIKNSALSRCPFVEDCLMHHRDITDEQWTQLMRILEASKVDIKLIDSLMATHSDYTFDQLKEKYLKTSNDKLPTCKDIKKVYQCPKNCGYALQFEKKTDSTSTVPNSYVTKDDGIYAPSDKEGPEKEIKICGPLKILGRIRNKK